MGVLTLNIEFKERGIKKTMQFEPRIVVYDACRLIRDKFGLMNEIDKSCYGLFRVEDDPSKCVWMENGRTLEYYLIRNGDTLEYKNKIRHLRVRTIDKNTVKTVPIDESQPVSQLMVTVCSKMGISNHEEYSLVRANDKVADGERNGVSNGGENGKDARTNGYHSGSRDKKFESSVMNTIGRNKEREIQKLRAKLHTDEDIHWVDQSKTLREQNIGENETLILRRKFFFSDTNIDTRDPVQLDLLYLQCRDGVLNGLHPVSRDTAIKLAALQYYIEYGPYEDSKVKSIDVKQLLPKEYAKAKEHEKNIVQEYRELMYEDLAAPKKKYCELCQSLPTYGVTFFLVKEKLPGKNKLIPRLLGINKESVMRVDEKTKAVLKEWPLEQVRRWAASYKTFTLDFGDYKDGYYSVQTTEGEKICQLIGGYIDIIMKKKRVADHLGIEGDEGSTMLEDVVAPARATLIAHGELGQGFAQDGNVALPGVLRSAAGTPSMPGGLQYGAVGGRIISQEMPRGERIRYVNSQERSQRALIGTIEATIRAVEEAEEEMSRPPHIPLPQFDEGSRHWHVEVEKEAVEDRIAAMGAATAEVVQLTAIPEESDNRVGTAIATIGSNLPEMGRGVRQLAGLMPDEHQAGDLIDAARKLCGAFGNFLDKVHPDKKEKRANILSAASRVGELSRDVINTMNEQTVDERDFHEQLNYRARNVATSTAKLVLQAKTVSADCNEPALKEQVIHSAMKTAFATSELIACTRIVGPTIEHQASRDHLTEAAHNVARAVGDLMVDASGACNHTVSGTGVQQYGNLHEAAQQVSNALDELIDHVNNNTPSQVHHRSTQENYSYEQLVQSSNRVIAHQGAEPHDLVRDSESAIRHSRLLVDEFENEARVGPAEQRDKLLNAARSVAQATSNMIDATKHCQSRPQEAEAQMALKNAAENLVQVTNHATVERNTRHTIQRLERAAKDTSSMATQTIASANAVRPHIQSQKIVETLVTECTETNRHITPVIQRIKESQSMVIENGAPVDRETRWRQFNAHSGLIHDTSQMIQSASKLVDVSRATLPYVNDEHTSSRLFTTGQDLSTQLAELRVALNNAQQLHYELQLEHSEDLIRELDSQLVEVSRLAKSNFLQPSERFTAEGASGQLANNCRLVGSGIAQLISSSRTRDRQHIGCVATETVQALHQFVDTIRDVVATRRDCPIDTLILNARSVVHDSGRVFDRVHKEASPQLLDESVKIVSESIRKTLACLPDNAAIEQAIERIQNISVDKSSRASTPNMTSTDMRQMAAQLIESSSELVISARAPQYSASVQIFVNSYENFHFYVFNAIKKSISEPQHQHLAIESLETARAQALNVLQRSRAAHGDPNNLAHTQALSQASRSLTDTVNIIVEQHYNRLTEEQSAPASGVSPWSRECDNALHQIQSIRYVLDDQSTLIPFNSNSYYDSLSQVTTEARRLGDGMNGMAHFARRENTEQLCQSVRTVAQAVCGLAENAAHSAYLIGASDQQSQPGKAAIFDIVQCDRSLQMVKQVAERIEHGDYNKSQIINDATMIATHTSNLATICREASDRSTNVNVKRQFVNCARDITSATAALINSVKKLDSAETEKNHDECAENAHQLHAAAENLDAFMNNPEFGPTPGKFSQAGRLAQQPVLQSARQMLDASCEMIATAKNLDTHPSDAVIWQHIADNSRVVSESIKQLVAAIRDQAPGQRELDAAIGTLNEYIQQIDGASLAVTEQYGMEMPLENVTAPMARQQILHSTRSLIEKIDPLKHVATNNAEEIGHGVREHMTIVETLVQSCIQAASLAQYNSVTQCIFEQCKTVVEAEIQMFFAVKDSGGNPKAVELHSIVGETAEQLRISVAELQHNVSVIDTESGTVHGIVETISRSISMADETTHASLSGISFADAQTRMIGALNEIAQIVTEIPFANSEELGSLSLRLAESYRQLADDARIAQNLLTSPDLAQKLKLSVQKLGTSCIELVKIAGQSRMHPNDERIRQQLSNTALTVGERVREVLAALNEGSRGTQACINAAQTVSGIIGDLDTTIMFATSGSLNPPTTTGHVVVHRETYKEVIVKTAKALVEDTKALVSGAASNQEQLAVAAQNAVHTILQLTEAVKGGAATISADSAESQVMVIHAVRDVAAALSGLIHATKHASGRSPNDPAIASLKDAAKVMVTNVSSLLKTIKTLEDVSQRGIQALEAAMNAIDTSLRQYDNKNMVDRHPATADEVLRASNAINDAVSRVTDARVNNTEPLTQEHQELIIAAANYARQSVTDLLTTTRSASANANEPELKFRILNIGRDVAFQVKNLLELLRTNMLRPDDKQVKNNLYVAANEVMKALGSMTMCNEQWRADLAASGWPAESGSIQPVEIAEKELLGAAICIEEASVKLARIRPRHVHRPNEELTFDEQILSAAKSIATAVQTLVKAASAAQRELILQGRIESRPALSTDDYQWSEGLISAAKLVAGAVQQLCEAANALVQGHPTEDKLISAAKQVASSTAHVLMACKVKSDTDSRPMQRLQAAGHAVKTATERLVNAARQNITNDDPALIISDRMVSGIAQVMDAQEAVLRKERELEEARIRLAAINKSRYEKSPEPYE